MAGKVVVFLDYQNVYMGAREAFRPFGSPSDRQCQYWRSLPKTTTITRPLQYPRGWPREKAREKGIDVKLAIDIVAMAVRREFDVGVLMSRDTDLKPALEFVHDLNGNPYPRCEVAAWSSRNGYSRRLSIPRRKVWCHWLDESDYQAVSDPTNYANSVDREDSSR